MTMIIGNSFMRPNWDVMVNRSTAFFNKSLVRLLRKQKINTPVDNPTGFALSERMKAELRGLSQTDKNVQNGSTIVKIASDAVHIIIDVLQDMRALALQASDDTTTDEERIRINKEMMQRIAAINDVANGTKYNGVGLIDGTYDGGAISTGDNAVVNKVDAQDVTLTPDETYIKEVFINGSRVVMTENKVQEMTRSFAVTHESITSIPIEDKSKLKSRTTPSLDCDIGFSGGTRYNPTSNWNWKEAYTSTLSAGDSLIGGGSNNWWTPETYETGVEITFAGAKGYEGEAIPDAFHEQGFSILCNGCSQYINIVFDKTMNIGQGTLTTYESNKLRKDYRVGIGDATSVDDLPRAIFEGIKNSGRDPDKDAKYDTRLQSTGEVVAVTIDKDRHNFRIAKNPNYGITSTAEYIFVKEYDFSMLFIDSGTILAMGEEGSKDNLPQGTIVQIGNDNQPEIQKITVDETTNAQIWTKEETENIKSNESVGKPLIIQDGTLRGEYDAYYIKGMQSKNLTIGNILDDEGNFLNMQDRLRYEALSSQFEQQRKLLTEFQEEEAKRDNIISVKTVAGANKAIKIIDRALEYALKNAVTLGAYLNRMENDQERIYAMDTHTSKATSALLDIDTKDRITYARAHIVSEASQFIFAQAGQNSFSVLHLVKPEEQQ